MVRVGPGSATFFHEEKIPMDGRHYICSGTVILKNGKRLQAIFEVNTHTFDFLQRDTVRIYIDKEKAWYSMDEQELYDILKIPMAEALPYKWNPDKPLDYSTLGPYSMKWPEDGSI